MSFNEIRAQMNADVQRALGEPAIYTPKAAPSTPVPCTVIVHRLRADTELLNQAKLTATVFKPEVARVANGDSIRLTGSNELFKVDTAKLSDAYKFVVAIGT